MRVLEWNYIAACFIKFILYTYFEIWNNKCFFLQRAKEHNIFCMNIFGAFGNRKNTSRYDSWCLFLYSLKWKNNDDVYTVCVGFKQNMALNSFPAG